MPIRALFLVNLATLLWSGNIVLGRAIRGLAGPFFLATVRAMIAASIFWAVLAVSKAFTKNKPETKDFFLLAAMGLMGVVGFQTFQYAGLKYTSAVNAGLVNASNPIMTLLLARILLGAPILLPQMAGAFISLAGVAVVISGGSASTLLSLSPNGGDLLVLAAVLCWAFYAIAGKILLSRHPSLWVTAVSTLFALPMLAGPAVWEVYSAPPTFTPLVIFTIIYVGIGPGCLAFWAWNESVKSLGANGASAFLNTMPLYTAIIAAFSIGELPSPAAILGGLLIIAGCLLATLSKGKKG